MNRLSAFQGEDVSGPQGRFRVSAFIAEFCCLIGSFLSCRCVRLSKAGLSLVLHTGSCLLKVSSE